MATKLADILSARFHIASGGKDVFRSGSVTFVGREGVSFQIANLEFTCVFVAREDEPIQAQIIDTDGLRATIEFQNFLQEEGLAGLASLQVGHLGGRKLYAQFMVKYVAQLDLVSLDYTFLLGETINA